MIHYHGQILIGISLLTFNSIEPALYAEQPPLDKALYDRTIHKAIEYLRVHGQANDGSFSSVHGTGITALVTTALLRHGYSADDPFVRRSLNLLEKHIQPEGGIYKPSQADYGNYETCLALACFAEANDDGRYDTVIDGARTFILGQQWDEEEGKGPDSLFYGGFGYGKHRRPDLSNAAFAVEALISAGTSPTDDAIQRALLFISRCQNHETEHNTTPFSAKNSDGGFYYTAAAGGKSQAGLSATGGLRSYGSMTYAGLKSMIYAGVDKNDSRVKAAHAWIQQNYNLDLNPGLGLAGLYYYYHTFAKTLYAMDSPTFVDANGNIHFWQSELLSKLAARQQENGSWVNENERWLEGESNLVSGYALMALSYCRPEP